MIPSFENIRLKYNKSIHFKNKTKALYDDMDSKYSAAADFYGFKCTGCEDNCCFTRFHHYTFIEYFYLLDGFDALDHGKKMEIKNRADALCKKLNEADKKGILTKLMCPLNDNSLCVLYPYRPMICRLHGVPHELNMPGQGARHNPGCDYFMKQHGSKDYFRFDRTAIYLEMANLEKEFRQKTGVTNKIKLTVAEMISDYHFLAKAS